MSIEPGLHHGIPNAVYQAGLADPRPLQSTYAKNLITGSPAEFIWRREHRAEKAYFDAGQALHELVLEGRFTSVEVLPFDSWRTKASQEAKAAAYAAGRTPMLERDLENVYAMAKAVRESSLAQSVLTNGKPEVSALATDPETGLTLQARFDWLRDIDKPRPTIVDVKTTAKGASPRSFNREAADLRYHFSASFYSRVLTALGYPEPRFLWLVVGKDEPHSVSVIEYSEVDRTAGDALVDHALRIYAECVQSGIWPGWDTHIHQSSLPPWAHDESRRPHRTGAEVMKITAEPRSDQINADDFVGSAQTFTIAGVRQGTAEQKYDIMLAEVPGRVWRPPLTVLRLLIAAWGDESDNWIGKRVTLFRDSSVSFGRDAVGGIRISHMSDLPDNKPLKVKLTTKRGKRELFTVQPLIEAAPAQQQPAPEPTAEQVAACTDLEVLRAMWNASGPEMRARIEARRDEITGGEPK